jgi:hypothetical protein
VAVVVGFAIVATAPLPAASDALPAGFAGARGVAVRFGRVAALWACVFFALRAGTLEGALGAALAAAADNSAGRDSEAMLNKGYRRELRVPVGASARRRPWERLL